MARAGLANRIARPTHIALYPHAVMDRQELMSVTALGRTSLVVAASDGPGG